MSSKQSSLRREVLSALRHQQIVPHFQPLVQIRTGIVSGFEVLARWQHPRRGLLSAEHFIPIAEQTGLMGELTESILLQALTATAKLPGNLQISVNISPVQLRDEGLPELFQRVAEQTSFDLTRVVVEVTETALVENLEQAHFIASGLKKLGIKLALDDFGTGYSSLSHLQALPFDELKVDRTFVGSMLTSRESRKIVAAVIGLGQSLHLTTVAEGIEDEKQAEILRWLGCDLGQGWLYGRAVPAEELLETVTNLAARSCSDAAPSIELTRNIGPLPAHRLAQYEAIYDGAPVGLSLLNTELEYVNINQRLADMNGLPVSAHIGRKVYDILPPKLFLQLKPWIMRALNGEALAGVEVKKPSGPRPGDLSTLLVSYQPARDEAGEVIGVSVAVMDISERMRAEEALRESEDRYRHMVESSPHIPWVMERDGRNLEVSPAWGEMTGQGADESIDFGWMATLHPDDIARISPIVQTALRTGDPIDLEYRIHTKDDQWRWMRSRGKAHRGKDGEILRWYGCVEDVHEYKVTQRNLRETLKVLAALTQSAQFASPVMEMEIPVVHVD
jgi:PAS domain S-box-containing protein